MNKNSVILKYDSRDRHAHVRFGQTASFTPESNFGFDLYSTIEPESAVSCTAYSVTKIRTSQSSLTYDIADLWSKVPSALQGADPRNTLSTAIKQGLKYLTSIQREFSLKGYYRADTGSLRPADNVRSAMTLNLSSAMMNSYWYEEWNLTPVEGIMPIGKTRVSAHSYVLVDWKIINGQTVFLIDSHQGVKRYMPFEVLESAVAEYGCSVLMASVQEVLDKRDKSILETIKDACINLIIALKSLILIKQAPIAPKLPVIESKPVDTYNEVKDALKTTKIEKWAKAISLWEGDITGHNAGNLKFTPLTQSWGATLGRKAQDGGYFALFHDDGMSALCNFLTLGCKNQLKDFHAPEQRLLGGFMKKYAGNPASSYIEGVRKELGVPLNTPIENFL